MTLPDSPSEETTAVCPFVGLADDRDSHANYSTAAHRCYRLPEPTRIAAHYQESYCLTVQHPSCAVFQGEGVEATAPQDEPTGESEKTEAETTEEEVAVQADFESSYTEESSSTEDETYEEPEPTGPYGAKGFSEAVLVPTAAAIANAVYNAVGVRIHDLPITSEKILNGLNTKEKMKT